MIKKKTKLILVMILLAGIIGIGYYFLFSKQDKAGNTVADNTFGWKFPVVKFPITGPNDIAYSDIRDPGGIPDGLPVRLKIPIIGVDSAIEDALITPDGRMDVPQGSVDVAWFALGPHPGDIGSAVIGGHFGIQNGVKFVFYDLDKLKVGDKIYIENDKGETIAFKVRRIQLFDRNADATTVFTSDDGLAHLNLITCEGIWNQVNGLYPSRRVVFTDAIPSEGPIVVNPKLPVTSLPVTPVAPASKPTPASTTTVATKPAQTPAAIPAETEIKTETAPTPNILNNPPSKISKTQTFFGSLRSLYGTWVDGLITSLLLIAILFVAFKIKRRI